MKLFALSFAAVCLLLSRVDGEDAPQPAPELSALVGRVFLTLSRDLLVAGQDFDVPTLWANARLGHVEYPNGKGGGAGTRFETEYVPTDSGIVVRFYGPYAENETQKAWGNQHDKTKRTFEVVVSLGAGKFIGITGSYGAAFSLPTVDGLIALGRNRPR